MCEFRVGDEVIKVSLGGPGTDPFHPLVPPVGAVGRVIAAGFNKDGLPWIHLAEWPHGEKVGHAAENWKKLQRRKTDLSIEAFLTIKPGFEEPRRVKERAGEKV